MDHICPPTRFTGARASKGLLWKPQRGNAVSWEYTQMANARSFCGDSDDGESTA